MSNYDALVAQFALVTKQFVDLKTKFVSLSKEKGPKGDKGDKGDTGKTGNKGDAGDTGPAPEHKWRGTKLQFQHPDGSWGDPVDLKGKEGKSSTSFVGFTSPPANSGGGSLFRQVPLITLAAGEQVIDLGIEPVVGGVMQVFVNGVLHLDAVDYSVTGSILTLTVGVGVYAGDHILVVFQ